MKTTKQNKWRKIAGGERALFNSNNERIARIYFMMNIYTAHVCGTQTKADFASLDEAKAFAVANV